MMKKMAAEDGRVDFIVDGLLPHQVSGVFLKKIYHLLSKLKFRIFQAR